jgi:hypothetical protein
VVDNTKQLLEQINEISRQLLSRILTVQKSTKKNITDADADAPDTNSSITEKELTDLMAKRDKLIRSLFKEKLTEDISKELSLLNEMISLDSELSSQSQACKKILANQVIRLKKSKKVTKSYQQY